jgi:hypothetical protein
VIKDSLMQCGVAVVVGTGRQITQSRSHSLSFETLLPAIDPCRRPGYRGWDNLDPHENGGIRPPAFATMALKVVARGKGSGVVRVLAEGKATPVLVTA